MNIALIKHSKAWVRFLEIAQGLTLLACLLALMKYLLLEEFVLFILLPCLLFFPMCWVTWFATRRIFRIMAFSNFIVVPVLSCMLFHLVSAIFIIWINRPIWYTKQAALLDVDFLIERLEELHPNPYEKLSRESFAHEVQSTKAMLPERVELLEFYKQISRLFAMLGDAHTVVAPPTRGGRLLFRRVFPYRVRVIDGRLFVVANYSLRDAIPVGSELLSINGVSASLCISQVGQYVCSDTTAGKLAAFENSPWSALFFGLWNNFGAYQLEYVTPRTTIVQKRNAAGALFGITELLHTPRFLWNPPYDFKTIGDVGYLRIYAFKGFPRQFRGFLNEIFSTMQSQPIHKMIIDIRENPGGDSSLIPELLQYISPRPFRFEDLIYQKVSNTLIRAGKLEWIAPQFRISGTLFCLDFRNRTIPLDNGLSRFQGDIVLLTSGTTGSAATQFASAFRCYGIGTILGSETGSAPVFYTDSWPLALPRAHLTVYVPTKKLYSPCSRENSTGVLPDIHKIPSLQNQLDGADTVLIAALAILERQSPASKSDTN